MSRAMHASRRGVLAAAAAAATLPLLPGLATAQAAWPHKAIKLIVPFGAGASTDAVARFLASQLSTRLGQPVVVENKVGAGGAIGTAYVASQPADGHTLLVQGNNLVVLPLLTPAGRKQPYDALQDFQPVGLIGTTPFMLVVSNAVPASTLREFIALVRSQPNAISYASGGVGSMNHLGGEMLNARAGTKMVHVPYSGLAPAIAALMGDQVQMLLGSFASVLPHVRAGKMRALAVTGAQRSPVVPDLPTVAEAALPGFALDGWWGVLGPAGMPAPVLKRLNDELNAVLRTPGMAELLARDGAAARPGSPQDYGDVLRAEIPMWQRLIQDAQISAE